MKKLLIITAVLLAQISVAQVTKKLGDFDQLRVFDKLNVKLIPSSENKIIISGNREKEVEVINNNGELKIRMPFPKLLSGDDISVQLFFKNIESIDASEGSIVSSEVAFKQTSIDLNTKEGSQIKLKLEVENVNSKMNSGGILDLSGSATNQNTNLTTGGVLNAKDLQTSISTISISAGGNAEINATTLVNAKVKAGGSIDIYGKPKQINKETFLGGTITERN